MLADITVKDYYLRFVHESLKDRNECRRRIDEAVRTKDSLHDEIEPFKGEILSEFGLSLGKSTVEWGKKRYSPEGSLHVRVARLYEETENHPKRELVLMLVKYCEALSTEYRLGKMLETATKRASLTLSEYKEYLQKYYNEVHKCILKGMGYKYGYGIGTFACNYWKVRPGTNRRPTIDFTETTRRKKELLAKGVKLYDSKEAAWYEARGLPYDGVDYRVWKVFTEFYEFAFTDSTLARPGSYRFQNAQYFADKYRKMGYAGVADTICKNEEDVYNLQVSLKAKLNILLYKYPIKYLNYVRTVDQYKHKRRANNSKDRQRLQSGQQ